MNKQLLDSLPNDLKSLVNNGKYEEAFQNTSSINEENAIAELYLEDEFSDVWPQLQQSKDILIKICSELETLDNEFITFTKLYRDYNQDVPSRAGYVALNNLYSKGTIDEHDLDDTSKENTTASFSIIFNPDLYKQTDIEFLITSYYWLSQKSNQRRMNLEALSTGGSNGGNNFPREVTEVAADMLHNKIDYSNALRNIIVYQITKDEASGNSQDLRHAKVRNKNDVSNILKVAANRNTTQEKSNEDNITGILASISKLTDAEKRDLYRKLGL